MPGFLLEVGREELPASFLGDAILQYNGDRAFANEQSPTSLRMYLFIYKGTLTPKIL